MAVNELPDPNPVDMPMSGRSANEPTLIVIVLPPAVTSMLPSKGRPSATTVIAAGAVVRVTSDAKPLRMTLPEI